MDRDIYEIYQGESLDILVEATNISGDSVELLRSDFSAAIIQASTNTIVMIDDNFLHVQQSDSSILLTIPSKWSSTFGEGDYILSLILFVDGERAIEQTPIFRVVRSKDRRS